MKSMTHSTDDSFDLSHRNSIKTKQRITEIFKDRTRSIKKSLRSQLDKCSSGREINFCIDQFDWEIKFYLPTSKLVAGALVSLSFRWKLRDNSIKCPSNYQPANISLRRFSTLENGVFSTRNDQNELNGRKFINCSSLWLIFSLCRNWRWRNKIFVCCCVCGFRRERH